MGWGFDRLAALQAGVSGDDLTVFAKTGSQGIMSAIMATFAITPWAFVGFETIPQAAEEFNFKHSKVMTIMGIAILFGIG